MHKKTVFLLQDTKKANEELIEKFNGDGRFTILGEETAGNKGIEEILRLKPDVVVLEIVLTECDGFKVIESVLKENQGIKFVVLSILKGEEMIERAMNVGAKYFMAKPFNFDVLRDRILELDETLAQKQNGVANRNYPSLDERISNIFINVGIPPHIKGYSFLREGVKMAVENPSIINNITKKLYPMIGEKYQTTASKVERAIRHAIEVAWNRGRIESINNILGVRAISKAEKPTNGEFIALVADKMLLERA